jgi:hypothetical protein
MTLNLDLALVYQRPGRGLKRSCFWNGDKESMYSFKQTGRQVGTAQIQTFYGRPTPSAAEIAATGTMKYYVYISDTKVDMLFPQVPHDIKKKVATEWKMDLKLLSASRRVETEGEDNRIARLETVVDFIREYGNIGTVDEPAEYISDVMDLQWRPMEYGPRIEAAYFTGKTESTIVGLGGSLHHLVGNTQNTGFISLSNVAMFIYSAFLKDDFHSLAALRM